MSQFSWAKTQNEMMTTLAQNQIQLQENNTVMMTDLLSSHPNLYVLADIEVYDGKNSEIRRLAAAGRKSQ